MPNKFFKKGLVVGIIAIFILMNSAVLSCISATNVGYELNRIATSNKDENHSIIKSTGGESPLPPVMWTEDFFTFYISIPQNPDGDQVYLLIEWGDGTNSEWMGPYEPGETVEVTHVWNDEGTYQIKVKAKDQDGESKYAVYSLTLSFDFNFFGVVIGYSDITYTFTFCWKGYDYYILIYWDDGNMTEWLGPYESNETIIFSYAWGFPGEYVFRFKLKDIYGNESDWITLIITILPLKNNAPNAPKIKGKRHIDQPGPYDYKFKATDPEGDFVRYLIDWDDGAWEWTDYYASGEEVIINHTWDSMGTVTVKARANDTYGALGPWGYLEWSKVEKDCLECQSNGKTRLAEKLLNRLEKDEVLSNVIDSIKPQDNRLICEFLERRISYFYNLSLYFYDLAGNFPPYPPYSYLHNIFIRLSELMELKTISIVDFGVSIDCWDYPYP